MPWILSDKSDRQVTAVALPEDDFEVYDTEDSKAQIAGVLTIFKPSQRVIDLGAGRGRIALPLVGHGVEVLAVDRDAQALAHSDWTDHGRLERLHEDFLSPHATWFDQGAFDGVVCLGNTLNLVNDADHALEVFQRAFRTLSVGGSFLIDDFPVWGPDMISTEWPLGISPDGTQQVVWSSCGRSFAYRTGHEGDSKRRFPGSEERLLRAWNIDELEKMASQSGFGPLRHDGAALMIHFARSN